MSEQIVNDEEYHVASYVAHAMPDQIELIQHEINQLEGAEIHATSDIGKIVFTLEATNQKKIANLIDTIRHHKGLLNLAPVYHQFLNE
ncbi:chaperone NapD [Thalassotalea sp. PLHSN55]|uniref:chaperone NapD n=1 Tax=Thalassotalea sp. PLHSN55 TaxID=3435888 RepID=UPI003F86AC66